MSKELEITTIMELAAFWQMARKFLNQFVKQAKAPASKVGLAWRSRKQSIIYLVKKAETVA